jgi:hypothetical protein
MTDHDDLAAALVAALATLVTVEKTGTGNYGSYADLADLGRTAKPTLALHGLTYMQNLHEHGNGLAVTTTLLHESGGREVFGPLSFPHGQNAPATGSYITYMRRYALAAALGLAPGDADDDGQAAIPAAPAPAIPGFRSSLIDAVAALSEAEKELLRAWLVEEGLPDRPSKMNEAQCGQVVEWLMHGLPKVEDS